MVAPRIAHLVAFAALAGAVTLWAGAGHAGAAWPGQNGPIAFSGGDAGSATGLWSSRQNGTRLRRLTSDPTDSDVQASADGRWIVFIRSVETGGETAAAHVFLARADGGGVRQVTTGPVFDRTPSFSRSGSRIFFSRFVQSSGEKAQDVEHIFSVDRDGSGLRRITSGPFSDRNPVASPNGRLVAFDRAGTRPGQGGRHVYTMRPNGSRVAAATPQLAAWSSQPDFSPSGERIVFVRGFPGAANADLFTMRPNGRGWRRLTGRAGRPLGKVSNPAYSPDGRFVVTGRSAAASSSRLEVIRVRDRRRVATLGGRQAPRSPEMQNPAWIVR